MDKIWSGVKDDRVAREPRRMNVPFLSTGKEVGLGEVIKRTTLRLGIQPCDSCNRRASRLDAFLVFGGSTPSLAREHDAPPRLSVQLLASLLMGWMRRIRPRRRPVTSAADPCWRYYGRCASYGRTECVRGPATQDPDAEIIEQCCGSIWVWLYPWIEVCPGERARTGCSFCVW